MTPVRTVLVLLLLVFATYSISQSTDSISVCGSCHVQAWDQWVKSRHAFSQDNPLVMAMQDLHTGTDIAECQVCHNPAKIMNLPANSITHNGNGITCSVCHAVKFKADKDKYEFEPVDGFIGPFKNAVESGHKSIHSSFISKSEYCMACHRNTNAAHGIAFIDVVSEWENTTFAENNIECQDCHMPSFTGISAPNGKERSLNYHTMPGGLQASLLQSCITINSDISRHDNEILVTVSLVNDRAGHAVPTASPFRMIVLTIEALDEMEQTIWKNYRRDPIKESPNTVFTRLLQDNRGNAPALPWEAAGERFDSRLFPGEKKDIRFSAPADKIALIKISLDYYPVIPALQNKLLLFDDTFTTPINISTKTFTMNE